MNIETVSELAEQLADWFGVYGCCKSDGENGCEFNKDKPFCCRFGFVSTIEERIRKSVENEKILNQIKNNNE